MSATPVSGQAWSRDQRIAQAFGLTRFDRQQIHAVDAQSPTLRLPVLIDGQPVHLLLNQHSMRASDFHVFQTGADGSLIEVAAPPPQTFRGVVEGMENSRVSASINNGQLHAAMSFGDGSLWHIQPVSSVLSKESAAVHIAYRDDAVLDQGGTCGVPDDALPSELGPPIARLEGGIAGSAFYDTEIALDADYEYFLLNGSSVANTVADMENVMAAVETIYMNQVDITYSITSIIVRTTEPDPYSATNPNALLCQFRNHWNVNHTNIARDVAHLFTGKEVDGNVIGLASVGVICNSTIFPPCDGSGIPGIRSYGLSQSRYFSNLALRTVITAHELGHNWNANHCDADPDCGIMCSGVGGCTGSLTTFGSTPTAAIVAWRNQTNCLTVTNVLPGSFSLQGPANAVGQVGTGPTFTWTPAQFALTYTLMVDDDADFSSPVINVATAALSYAAPPNTLAPQTYYFWRVIANNNSGSTISLPAQRVFLTTLQMPATFFVDHNAGNQGSGGSWSTPRSDLNHMMSVAAATNGTIFEIRVADGVYKPAAPGGDRTASFHLANGLAIKGGYAGIGAPNPNARDIDAYPTVLSGDLDGNDGPVFANYDENSYHVVRGDGVNSSAVLDGVTVRGGHADQSSGEHSTGGGLLLMNAAPTVRDCTFTANDASYGGAVYVGSQATPDFNGCTFTSNAATQYGGAAFIAFGSATFNDCTLTANTAVGLGGAVYAESATLTHVGCTFQDNSSGSGGAVFLFNNLAASFNQCGFLANGADYYGGAIYGYHSSVTSAGCTFQGNAGESGGAVHLINEGNFIFNNCTFTSNVATLYGGAAQILNPGAQMNFFDCTFTANTAESHGGAMFNYLGSDHFRNCAFEANKAGLGDLKSGVAGAVYGESCNQALVNCTFQGNSANVGGAIGQYQSFLSAINCKLVGNTAVLGGAIINYYSSSYLFGCALVGNTGGDDGAGAIYGYDGCSASIYNCTLANNAGDFSGGIYFRENSTVNVINSIFWNNTGSATGEFAQINWGPGVAMSIAYSVVQGWTGAMGGTNNSGINPLFLDVDGADNVIGTLDDNVRNERRSLGIDLADGTSLAADTYDLDDDSNTSESLPFDVYGQPRVVNCLDIGAAEYDGVDMTPLPVGCDGSSATACFQGIGDLPGGDFSSGARSVSADGTRLGVYGAVRGGFRKCIWSASGWLDMNAPDMGGWFPLISGDGRSAAINVGVVGSHQAWRWNACSGLSHLGTVGGTPFGFSNAISHDGSVIVGMSYSPDDTLEAFRWDTTSGMVGLGDLPGGGFYSIANGVSADANTIAGESTSGDGSEACMWAGSGIVGLGFLAGGAASSVANAVSTDGMTFVGHASSPLIPGSREAFRYTKATGMQGLGFLPTPLVRSEARDVSADGSVIVGWAGSTGANGRSFYWIHGRMHDLQTMLGSKYGLEESLNGWRIEQVWGMSPDGKTLVGRGTNPSGSLEGWIAHIPSLPAPCSADVDDTWTVNIDDLLVVINSWGQGTGSVGDITGDGLVNIDDLLAIINAWGPCL